MSLLHPTRGELLDRMSIIQRRLIELELSPRNVHPSTFELKELIQAYLPGSDQDREFYGLAGRLAAINAALWERENRIRAVWDDAEQVATLAREIHKLNDWRAECIAFLDGTPNPKIHSS